MTRITIGNSCKVKPDSPVSLGKSKKSFIQLGAVVSCGNEYKTWHRYPNVNLLQYWSLLNWQNLRLRCCCVAVPVNWFFDIISSFYAKFKNVVRRVSPGSKLCATLLNIAKYFKTLRCGSGAVAFIFFNLLKTAKGTYCVDKTRLKKYSYVIMYYYITLSLYRLNQIRRVLPEE